MLLYSIQKSIGSNMRNRTFYQTTQLDQTYIELYDWKLIFNPTFLTKFWWLKILFKLLLNKLDDPTRCSGLENMDENLYFTENFSFSVLLHRPWTAPIFFNMKIKKWNSFKVTFLLAVNPNLITKDTARRVYRRVLYSVISVMSVVQFHIY